jgi:hypothetical protein
MLEQRSRASRSSASLSSCPCALWSTASLASRITGTGCQGRFFAAGAGICKKGPAPEASV